MMSRIFRRALLAALLLLSAAACRRHTVIPDDELARIFRDAFLTNAYLSDRNIETDSLLLYAPIFARYGYTTEDVQYTIGNFSRRKSARLSDVVEAAIALLEEEGLRYDREVAILDTVRAAALRQTVRTLHADSLLRIRSLRDTVRLSFDFEAEPGEYTVSYGYRIDSLDRNERLQSRMWLEYGDGRRSMPQYISLRRNTREQVRRVLKADTAARRLHLHLLAFPETPRQPSVTLYDLRITRTLPEEEALRTLYRQQLDLRIFADEFLHAALPKDSL